MATTDIAFSDKPERPPTHGLCSTCGYLAPLQRGLVTWHFQIRVRRGKDGQPEEYLSQDPCSGHNQLPDPIHKEN